MDGWITGIIVGAIQTIVTTIIGLVINSKWNRQKKEKEELEKLREERRKQEYINREEALRLTVQQEVDRLDEKVENEFNKLNSYTVFNGTMNLKHTYTYERDSVLGLKARGELTANATVYYEYKVDLKNANISVDYDKNTINITLPKSTLNEASVHRKNNTFKIVEDETTKNILMGTRDGQLLQRYWEETFDISAIDKIKEIYDTQEKQEYLERITKMEVSDLINTLGLNDINIKVNIK